MVQFNEQMDIVDSHKKQCIKCTACIDVCPRYDDASIIDTLYDYLDGTRPHPGVDLKRCLTCGLCVSDCPQDLGLKLLIRESRMKMTSSRGVTPEQTIADPFSKNNLFKKISCSKPPYRFKKEGKKADLLFFPGCSGSILFPVISEAMEVILENTGTDYTVMSGVNSCCGAVAAGTGNTKILKKMAVKNVAEMKQRGVQTIITSCPACFMAFKSLYPQIVPMDFEILHVSQYLARNLDNLTKTSEIEFHEMPSKLFYHDPCHLTRGMGVFKEPRSILEAVPGAVLLNRSTTGSACCGLGGGVRKNFPVESILLAKDRHAHAAALGSDTIVTNCPGCYQNLIEGKGDSGLKVVDLCHYVALAMGLKVSNPDPSDAETIQMLDTEYEQMTCTGE